MIESRSWNSPWVMAQEYRYQADGSTGRCDGGHILGVKRVFSVGTRRSVKRRSMYRVVSDQSHAR
jgi:hypothetical protein